MSSSLATGAFPTPTRFTFGTASLGRQVAAIPAQVALVHQAMDLGLWFHTSQEYSGGGAFQALRRAFAERPGRRPPFIAKIRCDDAAVLRFDVEDLLRRLDLERIAVAQVCKATHDRREIVDDLLGDGPITAACRELRERGLVGGFSLELFTTCSVDGSRALRSRLFDLYSFYWNPLEREIAADTWALLRASPVRVLALRTVGGGLNTPTDAAHCSQPAFVERFAAIWPLVAEVGCGDVLELSLRYLASQSQALTSIGGTSSPVHLERYAAAAREAAPLPLALVERIDALHDAWAAHPLPG